MILAIVQARMGSTRFPGKMLQQIRGKSIISYVLSQVKKAKSIDKVILATTDSKKDDPLAQEAVNLGFEVFRGSEEDVLDRFYQAAKKFNADTIIRITGDCPLMDPELIDKVVQTFLEGDYDYVSNIRPPTYPDGLDIEVFSFNLLETMWKHAQLKSEREHVTLYLANHINEFKTANIKNNKDLSVMRWTIDEPEDLEFIKAILEKLNNQEISFSNILEILQKYPDLQKINERFKRNEGLVKSLANDKTIKTYKQTVEWLKKAKELIPSASQTYSKSYRYFCEGAAPAFLDHGKGSHVWDIDNNEYIDFICALGPITVGYNNPEVNQAVLDQLKKGISFSQPTILEVQLAEKLKKIIPSAEMVRFVKNGSDATSAAIRLARAYTKKEIVLCCGYHGYQDWYIASTTNDLGIPESLKQLIKKFEYNDITSLKLLFEQNKEKVAAVIMEPMQDNGPVKGFLENVKKLTHENNAILIFDEVVSGFRMALGGAQEYFKVTPDMSAIGKGMGNGMPISAVVGKKEIMQLIDEGAFISATFGGETLSLAGALATLSILEKPGAFDHIWNLGERWKKGIQDLINKKQLNSVAKVVGAAPHCGVLFNKTGKLTDHDLFSVFQQKLIEQGILTLGINNFSLAHTEQDIDLFIKAADLAFDDVIKAVGQDSVDGILHCEKFRPIFKRN